MTPRNIRADFWKLLTGISTIALLGTCATIALLYHAAYEEQLRDLNRATDVLASLMESVAQFDQRFSANTHPQGSRGATLSQIEQGLAHIIGRHGSEELVIGRKQADRIQVLRVTPGRGLEVATELAFDAERGLPLFEGISGRRSSGRFLDYRGVPVLAAYAPVPTLEIAIVYKTDLAATRAPFVRAGAWALGVYLAMVGLFAIGQRLVTRRWERQLESSDARFDSIFDASPALMLMLDQDGKIERVNPAFEQLTGWRLHEIKGREWFATFLPERDHDRIRKLFHAATHGAPTRGNVNAILTRAGEERDIEWHDQALRDIDGRVVNLLAVGIDVTERKRHEEALRASEARVREERNQLRTLIDALPDLIYFKDTAGRYVIVNRRMAEMAGVPSGEAMIGKLPQDFFPTPLGERFFQTDHAVLTSGISQDIPSVSLSSGDKQERWYATRKIPLTDSTGAVVGLVGIGHDITQFQRAEQEIHRANLQLRHAQALARLGAWELDLVTEQLVWSDETHRIFDLKPAGFGGTFAAFLALVHPEDRAELERHFRTCVERRALYDFTHRICTPAGVIRWVHERGETFYDPTGRPLRTIGAVQDITEDRAAQTALLASQRSLNDAQALAHLGSWQLDLTTYALAWSDEIFRLFEIDPSKFGASYEAFLNAIHPDDRELVNNAYTESVKNRRPYDITHRLRMPDGRIKWVQERCETDYAPDGQPLRSHGTVQDVTERVLAEQAMRASLREKTTLLQEIHHRVKNNLQVVSSMLFFEQRQAESPAVVAQFQRSRDRVAAISLVHETLYQAPNLSGIGFSEYVSSLGKQILHEFSGRAGPVALHVEGTGFTLGVTEAVPCALIVNELLANSLKHAFPHGRGGIITIRLETAPDGARHLWFGDSGVGVPGTGLPQRSQSLGMKLIDRLTEQLQATLVREPAAQGILYHLAIPAPATT